MKLDAATEALVKEYADLTGLREEVALRRLIEAGHYRKFWPLNKKNKTTENGDKHNGKDPGTDDRQSEDAARLPPGEAAGG